MGQSYWAAPRRASCGGIKAARGFARQPPSAGWQWFPEETYVISNTWCWVFAALCHGRRGCRELRAQQRWSPQPPFTPALPWLAVPQLGWDSLNARWCHLVHYENLKFLPRKTPGLCSALVSCEGLLEQHPKVCFAENIIYFPLWNCRGNKARRGDGGQRHRDCQATSCASSLSLELPSLLFLSF